MQNWMKYTLTFLAGAAAGVIICRNSGELRNVCTRAIGGALDIKDKAMEKAEIIKESAEDLIAESDNKRKTRKA